MKKLFLSVIVLLVATVTTFANNIQISNTSLSGQNAASNFTLVNFDINWDNSWRTSTNESNYDGAWIFVKFRKQGTSLWKHATLNYVSPGTPAACGHTQPSGSTLKQSADGKGAWIYRDADGIGNVYFGGAQLRWNYGVDGVLDADSVEINVYAVEMVNVPTGAYTLGSGGSEWNCFVTYGSAAPTTNPYQVVSNAAIQVGPTLGNLYYAQATSGFSSYFLSGGDLLGPIPANYPKGFNSFWIMKYEASQQQYCDFINNLDLARATVRNGSSPAFTGTHPGLIAPQPERAYNNVNWPDLAAFADWSCLRPYTEMEFEKACRGANISPVPNEYPWGNTTINNIGTINYDGLDNEIASSGNSNYSSGSPRRCGIFATPLSNRQTSGGSYYGVMDMGGNVWEMTVGVGSPSGRAFVAATHGDGTLNAGGNTDVTVWANLNTGIAARGGGFANPYGYGGDAGYQQTSGRYYCTSDYSSRNLYTGIRLARTAE